MELEKRIAHLEWLIFRVELCLLDPDGGKRPGCFGIKGARLDDAEYRAWFVDLRRRIDDVIARQVPSDVVDKLDPDRAISEVKRKAGLTR